MTRGGDYRKILRSRYRHYSISKCDEALAIAIAISSYITIYKAIAIAKKKHIFFTFLVIVSGTLNHVPE